LFVDVLAFAVFYWSIFQTSPKCLHLVVVGRLVCLNELTSYAGGNLCS